MSNNNRKPGYYRVKYMGKWEYGYYVIDGDKSYWSIPMRNTWLLDSAFDEIDPMPIDPNPPALQLAGQLTAEEIKKMLYNLSIDHFRGIYTIEQFSEKFQAYLSQHSAQQTATMDAEIAKLRRYCQEIEVLWSTEKEERKMQMMQVDIITSKLQDANSTITELREESADLLSRAEVAEEKLERLHSKGGIELRVKIYKGQFNCYGTIAGYDHFELSDSKEDVVILMVRKCLQLSPGIPVRIIDDVPK